MVSNPLYVFEERHLGVYNEEDAGAEGLYGVLNENLREIGEEELPEKLWEAFQEGDEAEFYELVGQALGILQEVTDPDLAWYLDGDILMLAVVQPADGEAEAYEEILVANPASFALPSAEPVPEGVYEDEWFGRPIVPEDYGVFIFKVTPPGRGEIQIHLPEGADEALRFVLIQSIDGELIVDSSVKMTFLSFRSNPTGWDENAATVIRGWHEGTGRPGYIRETGIPEWWKGSERLR